MFIVTSVIQRLLMPYKINMLNCQSNNTMFLMIPFKIEEEIA